MTKGSNRGLRTLGGIVLGLVVWVTGTAASGAAEEYGRPLYLRYCGACHGPAGEGDGVVSQLMRPRPPDLTRISEKNGGGFPFYEVIRLIDGRETLRAHGDSDMPVWGEVFRTEEGNTPQAQAVAHGKVVLIADYLESIQQK